MFKNTTISVPSIMCDMCVTTITDALNKVDGVNNIDVNLAGKVAVVKFNPSKVDMNGLEKAITDAGYDANETPRNREAYENLPECCKDGK
ncbi:MAG: heavy-metal-associated domain-containing protein [Bacteroidetes bacterium]|nr:heavy-metal-associated domain-containing protein [Bacteroidota bacterium]